MQPGLKREGRGGEGREKRHASERVSRQEPEQTRFENREIKNEKKELSNEHARITLRLKGEPASRATIQ